MVATSPNHSRRQAGDATSLSYALDLELEVLVVSSSLHELRLNEPEQIEEFAAIQCLNPEASQTRRLMRMRL